MSERLARLGIAPAYRPHVRHFMARAKAWGLSQADIDAHLEFAAALPEQIADGELMTRYHAFADARRLPPEIAGLATEWRTQVQAHGIEALATTLPASEADHKRLRQIEEEMRKPRGDSVYWRDPDMRDEYLELLDRNAATPSRQAAPLTAAPMQTDAARKTEIEAAMREGRGGAYFRQGSAMPDEYRAILERETASPDPAAQTTTSTATPEAAGNTPSADAP